MMPALVYYFYCNDHATFTIYISAKYSAFLFLNTLGIQMYAHFEYAQQ